mmetsp:Transcript_94586/g.294641  ORF Transcript_94586/g.294641 Transcript_94586/m.294641 type:complete len:230 (-) Transcript_94586:298-987(-)
MCSSQRGRFWSCGRGRPRGAERRGFRRHRADACPRGVQGFGPDGAGRVPGWHHREHHQGRKEGPAALHPRGRGKQSLRRGRRDEGGAPVEGLRGAAAGLRPRGDARLRHGGEAGADTAPELARHSDGSGLLPGRHGAGALRASIECRAVQPGHRPPAGLGLRLRGPPPLAGGHKAQGPERAAPASRLQLPRRPAGDRPGLVHPPLGGGGGPGPRRRRAGGFGCARPAAL